MLSITIWSHQQPEQLLRAFNAASNARRPRVLDGKTPDQVAAERLKARRRLAQAKPEGRAGPDDIAKAHLIAEAAKEVSRPNKLGWVHHRWWKFTPERDHVFYLTALAGS